jgi:hypothetical protein
MDLWELQMDSKGGIDRKVFANRTDLVRLHEDFPRARAQFCRDVAAAWLSSPLGSAMTNDSGTLAVVITVIGLDRLDRQNGAAMNFVVKSLTRSGFVSPKRARGYIALLQRLGGLEVERNAADGRRRRLKPTPRLIASQQVWMEAVLRAVAPFFPLPGEPRALATAPNMLERFAAGILLRNFVDKFTIYDDVPEFEKFMNHRQGYLLLLHLAAGGELEVEVNRDQLAARFGVSAAHISKMLADAEAQGWLSRRPRSSLVILNADFSERLNVIVARSITIMGLWFEARFAKASQ